MTYEYHPVGTCSTAIHFELRENRVYNLSFTNGCDGNLKGIAALAEAQDAQALINRLRGIRCKSRPTSCPDQLAQALSQALSPS